MRRKLTRLLSIMMLLMFVIACKSENKPNITEIPTVVTIDIEDGGLLSSSPCGPPCFLGIQPDVTTYDEVIGILSINHYLEYCREFNNEHDGGGRGIKCTNSFVISFDSDRKLVTGLGFSPTSNITVQNVIDKFGDPANMMVGTGGYAKTTSVMRMLYPQYKMSLLLAEQDGASFIVQSDTKVNTVAYHGERSFEAFTLFIQQWSGYGEYIMQ